MLAVCNALSPALFVVHGSGGSLDITAPRTLSLLCDQALAADAAGVLIDLGAPEQYSHAGLAGLVELCTRLTVRTRPALCNIGAKLTAALTAFGLDRALPLYTSVAEALQVPAFQRLQLVGMKAVVLCAGSATRMQPMTLKLPKPMLDVAGQPLLAHVLAHLNRFGLRDIVLNPGHLGPSIPAYFGSAGNGRQSLFYTAEGRQTAQGWQASVLGSASTLARLGSRHFAFQDDTFVLCSTALNDIDMARMLACHRATKADVTIAAHLVDEADVQRYGILVTEEGGRVTAFQKKPRRKETVSRLANTGIYLMRAQILNALAEEAGKPAQGQDIADDLLPALLRAGARIQAYQDPFSWTEIGCGRDYYQAVAKVLQGQLEGVAPTGNRLADRLWVAPGAVVAADAEIAGPCHIGAGATIEPGARIVGPCAIGAGAIVESGTLVRDSLIWAGTRVGRGTWVDQMIAGPDWAINHHFADGHPKLARGLDGLSATASPVESTSYRNDALVSKACSGS
jgi:mannose-1-phosphate guanylyltransferase